MVDDSNVPTILNAMDYYSYGKILREYNNGAGNRYLSTGHERDQKTGLDYRGARYYDSDVARFLSTDPWAAKYPGFSAYNYVMGNPLRLIDPNGKGPTDWFVNKKTGTIIYIAGESAVTQEALDKMGSKYSVDDYKRLGDDNMFGKDITWPSEGVVRNENNEVEYAAFGIASYLFMGAKGYVQAQDVSMKEMKFVSGGAMDPNERITSTTYSIKEISERTMTWAKPNELEKIENVKEKTHSGTYSSITTVTYDTKVEAWSNKYDSDSELIYYGSDKSSDNVKSGLDILKAILDPFMPGN